MKRLYLSTKDKKWAGVCGGLAEYFDLDPSLVRIAWVVMTIVTGVVPGIVGYLITAIVVPKQPQKV